MSNYTIVVVIYALIISVFFYSLSKVIKNYHLVKSQTYDENKKTLGIIAAILKADLMNRYLQLMITCVIFMIIISLFLWINY